MSDKILVSIIIPCYNQAAFLDETLWSVFNQQYQNWECLLIDDGSTDATASIIASWVQKDARFRSFYKENSGVSATRNLGLKEAKGDCIQFLDADDVLHDSKLILSIQALQSEDVSVVCSNYALFQKYPDQLLPPFSQLRDYKFTLYNVMRYWNAGFTVPIHCWLFDAALIKHLQFPVGLTAQEDWVMWLQVFKQHPKVHYIDQPLALYRINTDGRSQTAGFFEETLAAIAFLKPQFSEEEFRTLYEAVIARYYEKMQYWKNREENLKNSTTYQGGLAVKKALKMFGLLPLGKSFFGYFRRFKS